SLFDYSYTSGMDTIISIPNDLSFLIEKLACDLRLSRNELIVEALWRMVESYEDDEVSRSLNEVYSRIDSSLDPVLMQMQLTALDPEDWSEEWKEWKKRKDEASRQCNAVPAKEDTALDPMLMQA
ncbi:MAG: hypothetical protein ACRD9Y_13100, partial [Blastocatellia bacterium]